MQETELIPKGNKAKIPIHDLTLESDDDIESSVTGSKSSSISMRTRPAECRMMHTLIGNADDKNVINTTAQKCEPTKTIRLKRNKLSRSKKSKPVLDDIFGETDLNQTSDFVDGFAPHHRIVKKPSRRKPSSSTTAISKTSLPEHSGKKNDIPKDTDETQNDENTLMRKNDLVVQRNDQVTEDILHKIPDNSLVEKAGVSDEKFCTLCQQAIEPGEIESHTKLCLHARFNFKGFKSTTDKGEDDDGSTEETPSVSTSKDNTSCQRCHRDLTKLNKHRRLSHINFCFDQNKETRQKHDEDKNIQETVLDCPLCGKPLQTKVSRLNHLKACSRSLGVSLSILHDRVKQQEEEHQLKLVAGVLPPPTKTSRVRNRSRRTKTASTDRTRPERLDADTQLALALSSSLQEQQKKVDLQVPSGEQNENQKTDAFKMLMTPKPKKSTKRGRKNKGPDKVPMLLLVSREELKQHLAARMEMLFSRVSSDISSTPAMTSTRHLKPTILSESNYQICKETTLWTLTKLLAESGSKKVFYVNELKPHIDVADKEIVPHTMLIPKIQVQSEVMLSTSTEDNLVRSNVNETLVATTQTAVYLAELATMNTTRLGTSVLDLTAHGQKEVAAKLSPPASQSLHETSGFLRPEAITEQQTNDSPDQSQLLADLSAMVNNQLLSDLEIKTSDGAVFAHKFMFAARFPHILKIIGMDNVMNLPDYDMETVKNVLTFIYNGTITSVTPQVTKLANRWKLTGFTRHDSRGFLSHNESHAKLDEILKDIWGSDYEESDSDDENSHNAQEKLETSVKSPPRQSTQPQDKLSEACTSEEGDEEDSCSETESVFCQLNISSTDVLTQLARMDEDSVETSEEESVLNNPLNKDKIHEDYHDLCIISDLGEQYVHSTDYEDPIDDATNLSGGGKDSVSFVVDNTNTYQQVLDKTGSDSPSETVRDEKRQTSGSDSNGVGALMSVPSEPVDDYATINLTTIDTCSGEDQEPETGRAIKQSSKVDGTDPDEIIQRHSPKSIDIECKDSNQPQHYLISSDMDKASFVETLSSDCEEFPVPGTPELFVDSPHTPHALDVTPFTTENTPTSGRQWDVLEISSNSSGRDQQSLPGSPHSHVFIDGEGMANISQVVEDLNSVFSGTDDGNGTDGCSEIQLEPVDLSLNKRKHTGSDSSLAPKQSKRPRSRCLHEIAVLEPSPPHNLSQPLEADNVSLHEEYNDPHLEKGVEFCDSLLISSDSETEQIDLTKSDSGINDVVTPHAGAQRSTSSCERADVLHHMSPSPCHSSPGYEQQNVWSDFEDGGYTDSILLPATQYTQSLANSPCASTSHVNDQIKEPVEEYDPPTDMDTDISMLEENPTIQHNFTPILKTTRAPKRHKHTQKNKSVSPFTPMANYNDMITPEIKKACQQFGVRAMPKKRMIKVLTSIYQETHQYETDSELEQSFDFARSSTHSGQPSMTQPPQRTIEETYPQSGSQHMLTTEPFVVSDDDLPEESFLGTQQCQDSPSSSPEKGTKEKASQKEIKIQKIRSFIASNNELYTKILHYEPLEFDEFRAQLNTDGIRIGSAILMDFLDEQNIQFTLRKRKEELNKKRTESRGKRIGGRGSGKGSSRGRGAGRTKRMAISGQE